MSRGQLQPKRRISGQALSGSVTELFKTPVKTLDGLTWQVSWTGLTGGGTLSVEGTLDDPTQPTPTPIWSALVGAAVTLSGSSGSDYIHMDFSKGRFNFVRAKYTHTSGSSTIIVAEVGSTQGD